MTAKHPSQSAPAGSRRLRPLFLLAWWIAAVVIVAGLLAPCLFYVFNPRLSGSNPFSRFVDRALLLTVLVGIVPYVWRRPIGLRWRKPAGSQWLGGVLVAVVALLLVCAVHLSMGSRVWSHFPSFRFLVGALATAVVVGFVEEILFRGVLQPILIGALSTSSGIIVTAALFSAAHFLKVPPDFQPPTVGFSSGFEALALAVYPLGSGDFLGLQGLAYFIVGLILGVIACRQNSLWGAIGLHSGCIISLKFLALATKPVNSGSFLSLAFPPDLLTGSLTLLTLALLALAVSLWRSPFPFRSRGGDGPRLFST